MIKIICWLLGHKIVYPYRQDDPCGRCGKRFYKVREPLSWLFEK